MQAAVDELWPYTHELFADDVDPAARRSTRPTLRARGSTRSSTGAGRGHADPAGRRLGARPAAGPGVHTEHLSYLLAEMQVLHRAHPGATW